MPIAELHLDLQGYREKIRERIQAWQNEDFAKRLWSKDPTLWFPTKTPEIEDRLGWLDLPETMSAKVEELAAFGQEIKNEGIRHAVLMGMGGSSLAPEVLQRTFGNLNGYPELLVLDTTHPAAVLGTRDRIDLKRTLFIVSSKSGTTTETLAGFYYFWHQLSSGGMVPGPRFIAITDPATPLEKMARERGFRKVITAPEDLGGRYSALSVFGLIPGAVIGLDLERLLQNAQNIALTCRADARENPCLELGAALGELALAGRDKVTFLASQGVEAFPDWIEQLIAESTGKNGKGIVPVAGEPLAPVDRYGADRFFVYLRLQGDQNEKLDRHAAAIGRAGHPTARIELSDRYDLGGEFFRWEAGVAAAGAVLGIHPFDQPDVQLAKDLARQAMDRQSRAEASAKVDIMNGSKETIERELTGLLAQARGGDYIGIQAYLAPTPATTSVLQEIRSALGRRLRAGTTLGYGPRFLHSTGQLHKGGPNNGVFLQLTDEPRDEVPVPETNYTFGQLIRAQAAGDGEALKQRRRRVHRLNLGADTPTSLKTVREAIEKL